LWPARRFPPRRRRDAGPQQLAMLAINPPTAALLLSEYIDLKPGEWVVQNAANSGVGRWVIAFAKMRGLNLRFAASQRCAQSRGVSLRVLLVELFPRREDLAHMSARPRTERFHGVPQVLPSLVNS
jgi:hypothetical protein